MGKYKKENCVRFFVGLDQLQNYKSNKNIDNSKSGFFNPLSLVLKSEKNKKRSVSFCLPRHVGSL